MKIAGRCGCGVLMALAQADPQTHRRCTAIGADGREWKQCSGPCKEWRPITLFWPDRVNESRQGYCRYCAAASARKSYRHRYWTDEEFRKSEIRRAVEKARRRRTQDAAQGEVQPQAEELNLSASTRLSGRNSPETRAATPENGPQTPTVLHRPIAAASQLARGESAA